MVFWFFLTMFTLQIYNKLKTWSMARSLMNNWLHFASMQYFGKLLHISLKKASTSTSSTSWSASRIFTYVVVYFSISSCFSFTVALISSHSQTETCEQDLCSSLVILACELLWSLECMVCYAAISSWFSFPRETERTVKMSNWD